VEELPNVTWRRMFGCPAVFVSGQIFGLVWKAGRIGLRLPEPAAFEELMAREGTAPWTAGPKTMSNWVLVPEAFHSDPGTLRAWAERAHQMAARAAKASETKAEPPRRKGRKKGKAQETPGEPKGGAKKKPPGRNSRKQGG